MPAFPEGLQIITIVDTPRHIFWSLNARHLQLKCHGDNVGILKFSIQFAK